MMTSDLIYNLLTIRQLTDELLNEPEVNLHLSGRIFIITVKDNKETFYYYYY